MASLPSFNSRAVQPIECFRSGWALIRDRYWFFLGITAVALLLGSLVPLGIIMGPMMCGLYLVFFEHMRGRAVEFNLVFKGFDRFVESLIATLIQVAAIFLSMLPFIALFFWVALVFGPRLSQTGGNHPDPSTAILFGCMMALVALVMMPVLMVISMLFSFTYPLIMDQKLAGIQAVQTSFKAAWANFWGLLGLLALNALLGMAGALLCYVGVFFVLPLTFAALAVAYRQVFGLASDPIPASPPSA